MALKLSFRARAAAIVCGLIFGAFLMLALADVSWAQAPAPGAETPAAATVPICDTKTVKDCAPDKGDTAWMLTSVALVLMMTIPGLGLFYGGMVRKMTVLATVMQSFAVTCLVTVLWTVVTYSFAFTTGSPFLGGTSRFLLYGMTLDTVN